MSVNDTFIVIPLLPILVLFYFVMRDSMSWLLLALIMACLGWAYDARLIRSVAMSLKTREFTQSSVFSGMSTREILVQEHLPYVMPIVFSTTMNNMVLVDRPGGDAGGARLHRHQHPDHRRHDLLGQPAHRDGGRRLVVDRVPDHRRDHDLHRAVPAGGVDERIHRSAQPAQPHGEAA